MTRIVIFGQFCPDIVIFLKLVAPKDCCNHSKFLLHLLRVCSVMGRYDYGQLCLLVRKEDYNKVNFWNTIKFAIKLNIFHFIVILK